MLPPSHIAGQSRPKVKKVTASSQTKLELWFNTYKEFFVRILFLNLVGISLATAGRWEYARRNPNAFVLGNLQLAILVRNELFIRFLYATVNALFAKWPPLWFRLACTSILQHLGGIHSGCAMSGFLWLLFSVVLAFHTHNHVVVVLGFLAIVAWGIPVTSALPWVRVNYHDLFELGHRFGTWIALMMTWFFISMTQSYNIDQQWRLDGMHFIRMQEFYFALLTTILVVIPWCTVRQPKVDSELVSPKVTILRFQGGMRQGLFVRIARRPLSDYHLFGIVSEGIDAEYHYLICGVQGDFTKNLQKNPAVRLWTRQLTLTSFANSSTLYKRGVMVCTGTGIGTGLSTCLQNPDWYLLWIGSDQKNTFGPVVSDLVDGLGPDRFMIWDAKQRGRRPDLIELIGDIYQFWGAEVIFIFSNYQGVKEMTRGCREAGFPAFGTLWDF